MGNNKVLKFQESIDNPISNTQGLNSIQVKPKPAITGKESQDETTTENGQVVDENLCKPTNKSMNMSLKGELIQGTNIVQHQHSKKYKRTSIYDAIPALKTLLGSAYSKNQLTLNSSFSVKENSDSPFKFENRHRICWDVAVVLGVLYTLVAVPLTIAFDINLEGVYFWIQLVIDFWYMLDVLICFKIGHYDSRSIAVDKAHRLGFSRRWFIFEAIIALPYGLIIYKRHPNGYYKLITLIRMMRVTKIFRWVANWKDLLPFNGSIVRISQLVFLLIFYSHINACVQFTLADIESQTRDTWVTDAGILHASQATKYSYSYFRALSHMLSIGYGHEAPVTMLEMWTTAISMLSGAIFFVSLVALLSSVMVDIDRPGSLFAERIDMCKEFCKTNNIPDHMKSRMIKYMQYKYRNKKIVDQQTLLADLSTPLQTDIQLYQLRDLIDKVPIFKTVSELAIRMVIQRLHEQHYIPQDVIFTCGELADDMFFITRGTVVIQDPGGLELTRIGSGSYFGEFAVLLQMKGDEAVRRSATAVAATYSNVYSLTSEDFKAAAEAFPELRTIFEHVAAERSAMNKAVRKGSTGMADGLPAEPKAQPSTED